MGPILYDGDDESHRNINQCNTDQISIGSAPLNISSDFTSNNPVKTHSNKSKLNDFMLFKSLENKISSLGTKIECLSEKVTALKSQELFRSLDSARHFTDYPKYLSSIKDYIGEDDDTESSSDDSYSQIEGGNIVGGDSSGQRKLNKHLSWLVQRCQFHAKWSWLLSEIQSTEFRLKHLKKYSDEIKNLKRKFTFKNDVNIDESARSRHIKLEKRRRIQIHNLLSPDLIKFVSPLYSNDDNSSDKFVQCRCRLGDTGPCILCCGMKNKTLESNFEFLEEDDMWKASLLDNSIHRKVSNIHDVKNQVKRNVLFNGYVKTSDTHWSYPRTRTSFSPILSTPSQPKIDNKIKINPLSLEFAGFNTVNKDFKTTFTNDLFQIGKGENLIEDTNTEKSDIRLPSWQTINTRKQSRTSDVKDEAYDPDSYTIPGPKSKKMDVEDICDEAYISRHAEEEIKERKRNYPQWKNTGAYLDLHDRVRYFHGFEYKPNIEYGFDLRLFPLSSDEEKQLLSVGSGSYQRSKRLKRKSIPL